MYGLSFAVSAVEVHQVSFRPGIRWDRCLRLGYANDLVAGLYDVLQFLDSSVTSGRLKVFNFILVVRLQIRVD